MIKIITTWFCISLLALLLNACGLGAGDIDGSHPSQKAPQTSSSISVQKNSKEQYLLTWQGQSAAKSYILHLSTTDDFSVGEQIHELSKPSFSIKDLIPGQTYYVKIVAIWNNNKSPESNILSFKVPPPAPVSVSAVIDNENSVINVHWSGNAETYNVYWGKTDDVNIEDYLAASKGVSESQLHQSLTELDFTQGDEIYYIVTAVNNGVESLVGESSKTSITITEPIVINQAPIFESPTAFTINENVSNVATLQASDDSDSLSFSISDGDDANLFVIDGATGELSFITPPDFETANDSDQNNSYHLEISVSDTYQTTKQAIQITVADVDETNPVEATLPSLNFANTAVSINEDEGMAKLTITLSVANTQVITLTTNTSTDTASDNDFTALNNQVFTIPVGSSQFDLNISITDDALYEGPGTESFSVALSEIQGGVLGNLTSATITINDNEPLVTGPNILAVFPGDERSNVDITLEKIDVSFDKNMATASINIDTLQLFRPDNSVVPGVVSYDQVGKTASFYPDENLISNVTYTIQVSNDIKDSNGEPLANIFSSSFTTSVPTLSINDINVDETASEVSIVLTLNLPSGSPTSINFATENQTATSTNDFEEQTGNTSFEIGETEKTIVIQLNDDLIYETEEFFKVILSNPVGVFLDNETITSGITVTIKDNESMPSLSIIDANTITVNEQFPNVTLTATLSHESAFPVAVDYATEDNTAIAGTALDYISTSGTLTIAPGETSNTITVNINNDELSESDETFNVDYSNVIGATLTTTQANITINDNNGLPNLTMPVVTVDEIAGTATITVRLNTESGQLINVDYATVDNTAIEGEDYLASNGTLTFDAGTLVQTFTMDIINDALSEATETFTVNLSNAINQSGDIAANIFDTQATVNITDADAPPTITISGENVLENATEAIVTISLSSASGQAISFEYTSKNGSATSGEDYTAQNDSVSITAGDLSHEIKISLSDDDWYEGEEQFTVEMSNIVNATPAITSATVTLTDTETNPIINVTNFSVSEATGEANMEITLTPKSSTPITVSYATSDDTATTQDYTSDSNTLTFEPGVASFNKNIIINNDDLFESTEQFLFTLSSPSTNATLGNAQAIIEITNDDAKPTLTVEDVSVNENEGIATVNVTLNKISGVDTVFSYFAQSNTADSSDYVSPRSPANFRGITAGDISTTVSVSIVDDIIAENDETFFIMVSPFDPAKAGVSGNGTVTILNDDMPDSPVLSLLNGNQQVTLTWPAVQGASSYSVYYGRKSGLTPSNYATLNGTLLLDQVSDLVLTGFNQLTNPNGLKSWVDYYFIVTALAGNVESLPSTEQSVYTKVVATEFLNDTGTTFGGNYPDGNNVDCTGESINQQDCNHGRDFKVNNDIDGYGGFSFTKLDENGNDLAFFVTNWRCVRDNVTNLIWEVKTNDGLLQDRSHTYTWFNSSGTNDAGNTGIPNGGTCVDTINCDTEKYVTQINNQGLCGKTDWRLPTISELTSIINLNTVNSAVESSYFPNTINWNYWSSTPNVDPTFARSVHFFYGYHDTSLKSLKGYLRLVRNVEP